MFEHMKRAIQYSLCFIVLIGFAQKPMAQVASADTIFSRPSDSKESDSFFNKVHIPAFLQTKELDPATRKRRTQVVAAVNLAGYAGSMTGLYYAWYKNYPQSSFHFFDDSHEWQQVDKAGHLYTAYVMSRGSMEMWRWAGASKEQRIWWGGLGGAVYQSIIETLDGFSANWGWSWSDIAANTVGSGLLVSQELLWDEQRISLKFSSSYRNYPQGSLRERADDIYGKSFAERLLKDYNAQTIWVSANIKSFLPRAKVPGWLNIAVGYGADDMYGASGNEWNDHNGSFHSAQGLTPYRQIYISPDVDFTRIPTKSKVVKVALFVLNSIKVPAPALEFSKGRVKGHWLHF